MSLETRERGSSNGARWVAENIMNSELHSDSETHSTPTTKDFPSARPLTWITHELRRETVETEARRGRSPVRMTQEIRCYPPRRSSENDCAGRENRLLQRMVHDNRGHGLAQNIVR